MLVLVRLNLMLLAVQLLLLLLAVGEQPRVVMVVEVVNVAGHGAGSRRRRGGGGGGRIQVVLRVAAYAAPPAITCCHCVAANTMREGVHSTPSETSSYRGIGKPMGFVDKTCGVGSVIRNKKSCLLYY